MRIGSVKRPLPYGDLVIVGYDDRAFAMTQAANLHQVKPTPKRKKGMQRKLAPRK